MFQIEQEYHKGNFKGFILQRGDTSFESGAISLFCYTHNIPCSYISKGVIPHERYIPSGSVQWGEFLLGSKVVPDYYPDWTKDLWHRKVWKSDEWLYSERIFVKPADSYKRFTGFVKRANSYKGKKRPPYYYSEVVKFSNEWRYYISNGKVIAAYWYAGDEVNTPKAPVLIIKVPDTYSGALDLGIIEDGSLALVESQSPFACGWYGRFEDAHEYMLWLYQGWKYLGGMI